MNSETPSARRVLLVEDDSAIREALAEVLVEMGFRVLAASDGLEGLSLAAEQQEPCPILLDWRMPVLDGPAFLVRLRELPRGREFPVILSTADPSATYAAVGDQVAGVLSKPFDLDALVAALDRVAPRPA
ncbi:MAG TPA: response regulator [Myxococcaceae bacterium]|nr:response regulator [Myxococcaceae bacterium]